MTDLNRIRALLGAMTVDEAFNLAERHAREESLLYAFDSESERTEWIERHSTNRARMLHKFVKEDQ